MRGPSLCANRQRRISLAENPQLKLPRIVKNLIFTWCPLPTACATAMALVAWLMPSPSPSPTPTPTPSTNAKHHVTCAECGNSTSVRAKIHRVACNTPAQRRHDPPVYRPQQRARAMRVAIRGPRCCGLCGVMRQLTLCVVADERSNIEHAADGCGHNRSSTPTEMKLSDGQACHFAQCCRLAVGRAGHRGRPWHRAWLHKYH